MVKFFRLLGILVAISLLALPLAGCYESVMTLVVTVNTPQNGATVTVSPITVSGTVNKAATVKINDVAVPVKGGKFSTTIALTEGQNVIDIIAISGKDTVNNKLTVTYTPSG